ncbi:histidine phosphatase family protein [Streptomyces sp. NPDC049040]|uniref:histidine phosphatase family protein n=1 Tax=Streptomyces sp. NPDC049040 TaxID=3365593 RepID=UPI0037175B25
MHRQEPPDPAGLAEPLALAGLVAVRHGQSAANVAFAEAARTGDTGLPVAGADADVALSDLGAVQSAALGRWFAGLGQALRPDLVVCSPYRRARETWAAMARTASDGGCPVPRMLVDERLRDREMGVFELHPPAALQERAPEEAERRARLGDWAYRPPGGESLADVALRVGDLLTRLDRTLPGRRVLLVAHDGVMVALRHVIDGIGAPAPDGVTPVPNASVCAWEGDGRRLRLTAWATTAHLTGDAAP